MKMKFSKILSVTLAVCMAFSVFASLGLTVSAETVANPYGLVLTTAGLTYNGELLAENDEKLGGGTYAWNSATSTLTLNNVDFATNSSVVAAALELRNVSNVTLALSGENTITSGSTSVYGVIANYLTITSVGNRSTDSLNISAGYGGLYAYYTLDIEDITLDIDAYGYNGMVIGASSNAAGHFNVTDSIIDVYAPNRNGIYGYCEYNFTDSKITVSSNPLYNYAISCSVVSNDINIDGSKVIITNSYNAFSGSTVNISDDSYVSGLAQYAFFNGAARLGTLPSSYTWWASEDAQDPEGDGTSSDVATIQTDYSYKYVKILGDYYVELGEPIQVLDEYTITYNLDGGTNNAGNPAVFEPDSENITLLEPSKTDFIFAGWYDNADFDGEPVTEIDTTLYANIELWAAWVQLAPPPLPPSEYTITYNLNDGTNNASNPATYTTEDASITLANPTKTGYTFNGWYNNAELSGTAVTTIDTTTAANIELWAKWTVRGYATNYYLYEGINNANNPTSYTVEYEDISLQAPTRGSFTFEGWYTSSAFTGEPITTIDTSQAKNLYFYAKWSEQDADGKYGYPLVLKSDGLYFNNRLLATNDPVLGGGSYSWVSSTKTLTMTNVSFTTGAIGAVTLDLSTITNVNLVLSGTNTFSTDSSSKRTMYTKGVNITGLTGKDADSLVLVSTDSGTFGNDDDVTINNITLDFRAEDDYAFYIGDFLNCNIENSIVNIQSSGSGVFCSYGSETSINHSVFNITNPKYLGFYGSTLKNINLIINDSDLSMNVGTGFYGTKLNISEDSRITVTATTQIFGSSTSLASLPDSYTWWANTAAEVPEGNGTSSDVTPYVKDTTHKYLKIVGSEYEEYVEPEPPTEYTITYNLNGGDNHLSNPATYTIEDADITLADPIKTGYTFGGWYNNFELSGTAVTTIDTSTAANIELWAKWTVDSYTATYNLNGGTNNASNPATYTIEDSYIPLSAPTKDGYIFEGWFDNADCDDERVDVINPYIHTNIELWAKWTLIPTSPTITHNSGDTTFELTANGFTMVSMSVAYIGSKDAANLDWAKFNALGLVYKTQNGNSGYIKYLSPADGEYAFEYNGYYAVYVKYVNGAGKTVSKCSTYFVEGNVNVFVKPALTQNDNTVTLALNDGNVTAVNMIYTGNVQLEINDWNTFVAEGQKRPSENTAKGYIKFANPQDASEFALTMPGYYTFYVKYSKNAESNVYRADYYTFQSSVTDADIAPTITHNSGDTTFELATNGFTMVSMSVAYIGNEDASNLDWAKFNELGLAYKTMNGNNGYKKYLNPADGEYAFEYSGYYAVYVKYVNGAGKTVSKCLTYFVEGGENVFVKPALTQNDNTVSLTLNSGNVTVVEMIYTGDVQPEIADWNTFVAEGQKYPVENTTKGYIKFTNPQDASEFALTMPGYYTFYVKYTKSAESNVYYADYFTFQSSVTDTDVAA